MEPRIFLYALIGVAIAGALALEKRLEKFPLSLPILFVGLGWAVFSLPLDLGWSNPSFFRNPCFQRKTCQKAIIMAIFVIHLFHKSLIINVWSFLHFVCSA